MVEAKKSAKSASSSYKRKFPDTPEPPDQVPPPENFASWEEAAEASEVNRERSEMEQLENHIMKQQLVRERRAKREDQKSKVVSAPKKVRRGKVTVYEREIIDF